MTGTGSGHGPSRRQFLVLGAGIFTVSAVGLGRSRRTLVRRTVPVMGTIAELSVVSSDPRAAHAALDAAVAELHEVQRLMSRFDAASDVGRANVGAATGAVTVSAATAHVIREGLRWAALEGSRFDPCLGRATSLWNDAGRTTPPDAAAFADMAGRQLFRGVEILPTGAADGSCAVRFHYADVALDLGGIAKGYGVDRAAEALAAWGATDGLVNVGGDLRALGRSEAGEPWLVGIRSPVEPTRLAGTLRLEDAAVATSGDYQQFFEHDGRRYHHLLDPATATPHATRGASVTVMAPDCMTADAASTAVFALEQAAARRVLALAGPGIRIAMGG